MAMTMHLDIVSAEQEIFSGTVEVVIASAQMGEVGIHPRHTQLLTRLKPGEVRFVREGSSEEESIYVSGGILEVQPHMVTVLSDTAVRARDLDEAAALDAKKAAEEALQEQLSEEEVSAAQAKLAQAIAQLRVIQNLRKKKIAR